MGDINVVVRRLKPNVEEKNAMERVSWNLAVDHHKHLIVTPDWLSKILRLPTRYLEDATGMIQKCPISTTT